MIGGAYLAKNWRVVIFLTYLACCIQAEGDIVTLSFVQELPDPTDGTTKYTTTWFGMSRIEGSEAAEQRDSAPEQN